MSDPDDFVPLPLAIDSEEMILSLQQELAKLKEELENEKKQKDNLAEVFCSFQLEAIVTVSTLKGLGEEISLSQGNHTEKKTLASALCAQAEKMLRRWQKKTFGFEEANYRLQLSKARYDNYQGLPNDF